MVELLRTTLLDHLGDLVGYQDTENRLGAWEWEHGEATPDAVRDVLRDPSRRVRLVQLIRALVRDRVSVLDLGPILRAFATVDPSSSLQDDVESVRALLPPEILGVGEDSDIEPLKGAIEAAVAEGIARDNGKSYLALPSLEADELLGELREFLAKRSDPVLVVRDAEVRRFARRLLEQEHASVPLLARSELPGPRWRRRVRSMQP
jgi:type III secretory pathway component EscV